MSSTVRLNLLPDHIRARHLRPRRIRAWCIAAGVSVALAVAASQISQQRGAEAVESRRQISRLADQAHQEQKRAVALTVQAAELEKQIAVLEQMRAPMNWSRQMAAVAAVIPPNAFLTRMSFSTQTVEPVSAQPASNARPAAPPPNAAPAGSPAVAAAPPKPAWSCQLSLEGLASEHAEITSIMRGIEATGAFTGVRMVRSVRETTASSQMLAFTIACQR